MRKLELRDYRGPVAVFAVYLALVAGTGAVLLAAKVGLSPAAIATYYRGSEATFAAPKSLAGLLEVAVPHLLAIPLALFAAAHLALLSRRGRGTKALGALGFVAAAVTIGAGFAVRYLDPDFAWLKLAGSLGLLATLAAWVGILAAGWRRS